MKYLIASITLILGIQLVTAQVPCSVNNLQDPEAVSGYLQWSAVGAKYFTYIDIEGTGNPFDPGCGGIYPYLIETVNFTVADLYYFNPPEPPLPGNFIVNMSIVDVAVPGDPCSGPGAPLFQGPNLNFSVGDTLHHITQEVNISVNGPFFVKYQLVNFDGNLNQVPTPIWDTQLRPPCHQWTANGGVPFPAEVFGFGNVGWTDVQVHGQSAFPAPSKVQVFHNSADQLVQTVDIRIDGGFPDPSFDNMTFRSSSAFIEIESDQTITITVNDAGSVDSSNPLYSEDLTLEPGNVYIVGASGILSSSGYQPSNGDAPFGFSIYDQGRITSTVSGNTDLLGFNGITDAPVLDINRITPPTATISSGMDLGEFGNYSIFETTNFSVEISDDGTHIQDYSALLNTWNLDNQAITICASGFMNPSLNSNGPMFGLWASLPGGGPMLELPFINGLFDQVLVPALSIYPNPTSDFFVIRDQNINGSLVQIFDSKGALKLSQVITKSNQQIVTKELSAGFYYILLKESEGIISGREKLIITSK